MASECKVRDDGRGNTGSTPKGHVVLGQGLDLRAWVLGTVKTGGEYCLWSCRTWQVSRAVMVGNGGRAPHSPCKWEGLWPPRRQK